MELLTLLYFTNQHLSLKLHVLYCSFHILLFILYFQHYPFQLSFSHCPFNMALFMLSFSCSLFHIAHFTFPFTHSSFHILLFTFLISHCPFDIFLFALRFSHYPFTWLCSLTGYTYQEWRHRSRFSEREEQADSSDGEGVKGSGRSKGHQMSGGRFTVTGTKRRNCEYIQSMASFIGCVVHCSVHKVDYQILYSSIIDLTLVLPTDM